MGYRLLVIAWLLYVPGLLAGSDHQRGDYFSGDEVSTVLVLGDSISAAYGIDKQAGWVALLQQRLAVQCPHVSVQNASVSGETTAGGLQRLPRLLAAHRPQLLVLELGGNDGLRGLLPAQMAANLQAMIKLADAAGAQVAVLGILMPPNLGAAYVAMFEQAIGDVAEQEGVLFLNFFLQGIAGREALMQADGLHPTAGAQPRLLDNALQVLQAPLAKLCQPHVITRHDTQASSVNL